MLKEILYFSHANGFPATTYEFLFSLLRDQFNIHYTDMLGHNPKYVVNDNWFSLRDELIDAMDKLHLKKVVGVGHSLGGVATLFAAIERPDLFKSIVLLDPPIFSLPKAKTIQFLKKINKMNWVTPGGRVQRRRTHWRSFAEALAYFRDKPLFRKFDNRCLIDYIRHGLQETEKGFELKFDSFIESEIYRALPHNYNEYRGKLTVPAAAIIGRDSGFISKIDRHSMRKNFNMHCYLIPGSHLFPFEDPMKTALLIKQAIKEVA